MQSMKLYNINFTRSANIGLLNCRKLPQKMVVEIYCYFIETYLENGGRDLLLLYSKGITLSYLDF